MPASTQRLKTNAPSTISNAPPSSPSVKNTSKYTTRDGSKHINVPKVNVTSDFAKQPPTSMAPTPGGPTTADAAANGAPRAVNHKKAKRRAKAAAKAALEQAQNRDQSEPTTPSADPTEQAAEDVEADISDNEHETNSILQVQNGSLENLPSSKSKKSKKKKKKGNTAPVANSLAATNHDPLPAQHSHAHGPSINSPLSSGISKEKIWNTSSQEERERIKEFWLALGEEERKSLVKVEKDAVLRKMKEQQKQTCSCTVCGRKRTAIEEELEGLYDAYYQELEQYAHQPTNGAPPLMAPNRILGSLNPRSLSVNYSSHQHGRQTSAGRIIEHVGDDDDEEDEGDSELDESQHYDHDADEIEDDEDDYSDEQPSEDLPNPGYSTEFLNFGNSLTVQGGILTVADDLLKNDGKKFIEMMEQLAERRMQREEDAMRHFREGFVGHTNGDRYEHQNPPPLDDDYEEEDEEDEDDYDEEEDEDEYEEDEQDASLTDARRMEEGRRMFQIFAARMFEQRVLTAYREKVAKERQQKLIEELEDESRQEDERRKKKAQEAKKKKDKAAQKKEAQAKEKARKEAEKAEEEAVRLAEEARKQEEARVRAEEKRKKKEAQKKAEEEERQRKEAERQRRTQEAREKQAEQDRKQRESKERERKSREEAKAKEKEARERKEREARERKEQQEREKREREAYEKEVREAKARAERESAERAKREAKAREEEREAKKREAAKEREALEKKKQQEERAAHKAAVLAAGTAGPKLFKRPVQHHAPVTAAVPVLPHPTSAGSVGSQQVVTNTLTFPKVPKTLRLRVGPQQEGTPAPMSAHGPTPVPTSASAMTTMGQGPAFPPAPMTGPSLSTATTTTSSVFGGRQNTASHFGSPAPSSPARIGPPGRGPQAQPLSPATNGLYGPPMGAMSFASGFSPGGPPIAPPGLGGGGGPGGRLMFDNPFQPMTFPHRAPPQGSSQIPQPPPGLAASGGPGRIYSPAPLASFGVPMDGSMSGSVMGPGFGPPGSVHKDASVPAPSVPTPSVTTSTSSHSRQASASGFEPGSLPSQPINRPTPIGRPASVVSGQRHASGSAASTAKPDIEDHHLGSSALLADSEEAYEALPPAVRLAPGAPAFRPGPGYPQVSQPPNSFGFPHANGSMWASTPFAASLQPLPGAFGSPGAAAPWSSSGPSPAYPHSRQSSITLRLMLCEACDNLGQARRADPSFDGFLPIRDIKTFIDASSGTTLLDHQILDLCDTEGNPSNGNGSFIIDKSPTGEPLVRFSPTMEPPRSHGAVGPPGEIGGSPRGRGASTAATAFPQSQGH